MEAHRSVAYQDVTRTVFDVGRVPDLSATTTTGCNVRRRDGARDYGARSIQAGEGRTSRSGLVPCAPFPCAPATRG